MELKVEASHAGLTLLSFLKAVCPDVPSVKTLKRAIDGKRCRINGKIETFSTHPVKEGQRIELTLPDARPTLTLPILYEDQFILICDKPPFLVSDEKEVNRLLPTYKGKLLLVHRLDKETSGLWILAKSPMAKEAMISLFERHAVEKYYLAVVDGHPRVDRGVIQNRLGRIGNYQGQALYGVSEKGKAAHTQWECLSRGEKNALLRCQLITGRTHQLRVHLSSIGHPILGDAQYGKHFKSPQRPIRHLLHASELRFPHPFTNKPIHISSSCPF